MMDSKTRKYLEGRVKVLRNSIKDTTTINTQIVLEQQLESTLKKLKDDKQLRTY